MSEPTKKATADLSKGVSAAGLDDGGVMLGHVGDQDVVLVRSGDELFTVAANCTHYRGPLAEGLVVGEYLETNAAGIFAAGAENLTAEVWMERTSSRVPPITGRQRRRGPSRSPGNRGCARAGAA